MRPGDPGRRCAECGKHRQNRYQIGDICRIHIKAGRQSLFSIITHLLCDFHNFFIALHTFRIQIGEGDVAAQGVRHIEERRLGIIALHFHVTGMVLLTAGNGVALFRLVDSHAEVTQAGDGKINVRLGLQPGQHPYLRIALQQRQRKQQSGHILGGHIALQLIDTGLQCAVNGKRHGVVILKRNALFGQFPEIGGDGTLGQSALSEKGGVDTQCRRHRNEKPQGRAAFTAVRHSRLGSGLPYAGDCDGAAVLPERCAECGKHVHGGGDVP